MDKIRGINAKVIICDDFHQYDQDKLKLIRNGFSSTNKEQQCQEKEPEEFTDSSHQ